MRIMVVLFLAHSWLFSKQLFTDCLAADFFLTRRTNWKCFFPFSLFFLVMYSMGYYAIGWLTCHLLLLATSTPASPCHSKKVSHFPALVVFIPGFCSCTMYSCCCCCCLCCSSFGPLASHLFQPLYHYFSLLFVFHTSSSRCPTPYTSSFYVLRTMSTYCHRRRCCLLPWFSKVDLPEAANNRYFFGRLSQPDHSHNNPGYLCLNLNTLNQVTPRE